MAEIIWMPQAIEDLEYITNYIGKDSSEYASLLMKKIFTSVETLKKFPKMGRVVPEFDKETLSELIIRNYRIIYQIKDNSVEFLTVFHGSYIGGLDKI
ncbi:MAG: type II toxin-antitoxin system RelE/ParE family toxin [Candidatus Lokiarchaeota archaeon]|nr:type II toxin-antitoxin system RelE/ParE family toxin [Candidatus Lokiarchaeota archaeon]